ncbi:hypothetical protein WDU94_001942 [Cyamophila willieti]
MSNLEKPIGDLSNEDIVNSLLEDFQNDFSLNTSISQEDVKSSQSRIEPKIIELDDSNSTSPIDSPGNDTRNVLETSQNENGEPNVLLNSSENESDKSHSNQSTTSPKDINDVNTNNDVTDINAEKDFDEEIISKDNEDEDHLSEDEGVNCEQSAIELKNQGNDLFKQLLWSESLAKYNEALRKCPKSCSTTQAICHANRAAVYEKMDKTDRSIAACSQSLALNPSYVKVYMRRARLYQTTDKLDEALADYQKIVELDPSNRDAHVAIKTLPQEINERNEKLKEEMLGKLKDLGNMILRPFGLSTNNFQMVQDPNSGGYSINFQQNAGPPS